MIDSLDVSTEKTVTSIITIPDGKICDYVDGKFRNDTPEEYVRQNIEKRLVNELKYSRDRIKIEFGIKVGSRRPRADIVIFPDGCDNLSQDNVKIVIECKKEAVEPTSKKEGIDQLKSYMSSCSNCEWGMWTNGKYKEVLRKVVDDKGHVEFKEYNDIPQADGTVEDIDKPKRAALRNAVEDNLLFVFRTCHNHIYANDGMQKQPAFFELLKVIFCKIEDEKNITNPLEFYATSSERSNPDGQLTVSKRLSSLFEKVKKRHKQIFEIHDEISLTSRSLAYIVSELQSYSLLKTNIDIKGKAYEELVGANLRGDRGEFFTPRNIMHMTVEMLSPKSTESVLDPACGTGGFLVISMNKVIKELESQLENNHFGKAKVDWSNEDYSIFQNKISEVASNNFFGFDINPDLVKATKMNMVMNNDGSGNILRINSLLPPHEWPADIKDKLSSALGINKSMIRNSKTLGLFDVIITNPPFGSKIPIKDAAILEQYDLGHIWENDSGHWVKTNRIQSSVPPEQLFIERCMQLLKDGGRMGIVLPDAILGAPGLGYIRQWIVKHAKIIASIDLHVDTFQPRNGTQTSVLFLQKKSQDEIDVEEKNRQMADYNIFMAMAERIGHDKRGNPLFKRDKYGNELLAPDAINMIEIDEIADGTKTRKAASKGKIIDDQTPLIAEVFNNWKQQEGIIW